MSPEPVVELARAKVNLALHVTRRREDGYHELDSVVAFADVGDRLVFQSTDDSEHSIAYHGSFGEALREAGDDIVLKAASLLQAHRQPAKSGLHITLEKNLPLSSGIGGGSSDAAATLRGLMRLWKTNLSDSQLLALALKLGADVPVCLRSVPSRMSGIGDRLEPLPSFRAMPAVLVNPGTPIATQTVFAALGLKPGNQAFAPIADVRDLASCRNDLEKPAMKLVPDLAEILALLRSQPGLLFARMSGSGATCFGLFADAEASERAAQAIGNNHPSWWVVATTLS
jgi:4-diphosphocytidyl-2-C-methyl-D-erythritol kinase